MSKIEKIQREIYKTADYGILKTHRYQPSTRKKALEALIESVRKTDGNKDIPILVDRDTMEINDGHRRKMACEIAKVPIYYIYSDIDMAGINGSLKSWSIYDYISHFAYTIKEYAELEKYLTRDFASMELISKISDVNSEAIKSGRAVLNIDYEKVEEMRLLIAELYNIFGFTQVQTLRAILGAKKEIVAEDSTIDFDEKKLIELVFHLVDKKRFKHKRYIQSQTDLQDEIVKIIQKGKRYECRVK